MRPARVALLALTMLGVASGVASADDAAPAPVVPIVPAAPATPEKASAPEGTLPVGGAPIGTNLPHRHQGTQLHWDPSFNRMDGPEMVLTGAAATVALVTNIVKPLNTGWRGDNAFDDSIRNALRATSFQTRLDVRDASDVGLGIITTFPILMDSLIIAYWYRGSDDVALQMGLIDLEALTIAGAIQGTANVFAGRLRPYGTGCGTQIPSDTEDCQSSTRFRSFFSGHSTLSFTSASLICAHHEALHLFESAADPVTCVAAYVAAASIATMRVVGDVHYATDVLTGAAVGTAIGLGVPLLHHYKRQAPGITAAGIEMHIMPSPNGASVMGTF